MPTFSKTMTLDDGRNRVIERTTDDPGEITRLRAAGWKPGPEEKQPEKTKPAAPPAVSGPKADAAKP